MSPVVDGIISELAGRQHGVVARRQLLALGISKRALDGRLADHRLVPLYLGVYAVGHRVLTPQGYRHAAVLACGPSALLSHKTAAAVWELLATAQTRVDVTVPGTSRRSHKGICLHRTRALDAEDTAEMDGIPITSVARTIVDLGSILNPQRHLRVLEQAERAGILNLPAINRAIERHPTRQGTRALRVLLEEYVGAAPTRSELENRFLELVKAAGLPRPQVNTRVAGLEVDFFWPQWRLVVELDGRAYHSNSRTFERDRTRDARLQRAGCRVLRVTHKRMITAPAQIIDDIKALAALAEG
jgi:very-short-patch-repair endonuclease